MELYNFIISDELTEKEKEYIFSLLLESDKDFIPPLSQRTSTTQTDLMSKNISEENVLELYFNSLLGQKMILCKFQEEVVAFMSYIPLYSLKLSEDYESEKVNYVSTIIVNPYHRRLGITEYMYKLLFEYNNLPIVTRTWSTNFTHIHILEKLHFKNIITIKNDRGNNIDTVYYKSS